MNAIKQVLVTINNLKKEGQLLSKQEIITMLEATKSITKHKETINSLIFFFTTLGKNENHKINFLTKRELQILKIIGTGESTKAISKKLCLSVSTIETHRKNIRKKLGIRGKGKLYEYAFLNNLKQLKSD